MNTKGMALKEVPTWQCTVKPSEETAWSNVTYWNPRDYSDEAGGRWLLFYRRDDLDDAWARAKRLCDDRVLPGVVLMQCATAKPPRHKDEYPIQFHTRWLPDAELLEVGRRVVDEMAYQPLDSHKDVCWLETGATDANKEARRKVVLGLDARSPWE